ncbi:DMT family transporter [Candidatus Babeliales bacterium]|nr:DMT family transporter [Candidatus Babeliales bacterium]
MLLVVLLYLIFAGMTFINSFLMEIFPYPIIIGMFRALGSGALIVAYFVFFKRSALARFTLNKKEWHLLFAYAVLIHAVGMCAFSYAMLYGTPVMVCFIYATAPFLTGIISYFLGYETLSHQKIIGLCMGFAGLMPVLMQSIDQHTVAVDHGGLGFAITFGAMICFCYGWILFKKLLYSTSQSIQLLNGIAMLIGGILSAGAALIMYGCTGQVGVYSSQVAAWIFIFMIASLLSYCLYAYLISVFSPIFISFAGFLEPAFGMLYGVFLQGYVVTGTSLAGLLVLFLGLYVFYQQELSKTA